MAEWRVSTSTSDRHEHLLDAWTIKTPQTLFELELFLSVQPLRLSHLGRFACSLHRPNRYIHFSIPASGRSSSSLQLHSLTDANLPMSSKKGLNWEATQSPTLPYLPAFGTNRALLTKSHYCESIFKIEAQVKNHQYTQNHSKCHAIQFI